MFAKPDYYLSRQAATHRAAGGLRHGQNAGFAWDHGDYAAEIDTNYAAFAGPGVKKPRPGRHGRGPTGPNSAGP